MGNTESATSNISQSFESKLKELLLRVPYLSTDIIEKEIVLLFSNQVDDLKLKYLANTIYNFACIRSFDQLQYIQLAQQLFGIEYQIGINQRGNFKEIFLRTVMDRFEPTLLIYSSDLQTSLNIVDFHAKLFHAGVVSSTLASHWLFMLNLPSLKLRFLNGIKSTVMQKLDSNNTGDNNILQLRQQLISHGILDEDVKMM
jgi:hypothetical protein